MLLAALIILKFTIEGSLSKEMTRANDKKNDQKINDKAGTI